MRKKLTVVVMAILTSIFLFSFTAFAAEEGNKRELLLVDDSGSSYAYDIEKMVLEESEHHDRTLFAKTDRQGEVIFVEEPTHEGRSDLTKILEKALERGYKTISFVTDGEQWRTPENPESYGDFEPLGFSGIDLILTLPEETPEAKRFIQVLTKNLHSSNLTVRTLNGQEKVIMNDFPENVTENLPEDITEDVTEDVTEDITEYITEEDLKKDEQGEDNMEISILFVLIINTVILAIILGILISQKGYKEQANPDKNQEKTEVPDHFSPEAVKAIETSEVVLLDLSGSMLNVVNAFEESLKHIPEGKCITFDYDVNETTIGQVKKYHLLGGKTSGWAAIKKAADSGYEDLTIVSDLYFTDSEYNNKNSKFKNIKIITPCGQKNEEVLDKLRKMAEQIEVVDM